MLCRKALFGACWQHVVSCTSVLLSLRRSKWSITLYAGGNGGMSSGGVNDRRGAARSRAFLYERIACWRRRFAALTCCMVWLPGIHPSACRVLVV